MTPLAHHCRRARVSVPPPGLHRDVLGDPLREAPLPDEAHAVRILPRSSDECGVLGKLPHTLLRQPPQRKRRAAEPGRRHAAEEVGLVLVRVGAAEELQPLRRSFAPRGTLDAPVALPAGCCDVGCCDVS